MKGDNYFWEEKSEEKLKVFELDKYLDKHRKCVDESDKDDDDDDDNDDDDGDDDDDDVVNQNYLMRLFLGLEDCQPRGKADS